MNPSAIIANDIADLADRLTDDLLRRHSDIIRAGEKIRQESQGSGASAQKAAPVNNGD